MHLTPCAFCGELRHLTNSRQHYKKCVLFQSVFDLDNNTCLDCDTVVKHFVAHVKNYHSNKCLDEKYVENYSKRGSQLVVLQPSTKPTNIGRPQALRIQ